MLAPWFWTIHRQIVHQLWPLWHDSQCWDWTETANHERRPESYKIFIKFYQISSMLNYGNDMLLQKAYLTLPKWIKDEMVHFCCNIFVFYLVWKYSILFYICWGAGCMHVYVGGALCVHPRGVWLSTGIDVHLWQASKVYMTVLVLIPGRCMRTNSVHF